MSYVQKLKCIHCNREYAPAAVDYYCPVCGFQDGILDVEYEWEKIALLMRPDRLDSSGEFSMWRYLPLLPIDDKDKIQHLKVGWTPLYEIPKLASTLGVHRCFVKDEGRNPTASFKDRASAIGVVKALEKGAERITCASTGNAASSLAGFAAAAGLPATIFVPERAPQAKIAQLLVFGAQVFAVKGTYDQAWELCMEAAAKFGWYNRNCAINPYLIEGKKTVSLELVEQLRLDYKGTCLDWVVVSVGDGCTVGGVWKGLKEMFKLGQLKKLPKILGVQATGCRPLMDAWLNEGKLVPSDGFTVADSIDVGHPRNFVKGMRAIVESGGAFVSISDSEILNSILMLAREAAVFGEPAGVAGIAGIQQALKQEIIAPEDTVALIMTGNGLKDIQSAIKAAGSPIMISPDISDLRLEDLG